MFRAVTSSLAYLCETLVLPSTISGVDLEPVDAAQEVKEASKCLPLVLPSLSWRRRQGRKTGEVLQGMRSLNPTP